MTDDSKGPQFVIGVDPAAGPDSTVATRFERLPDGTTRAYTSPEQKPAASPKVPLCMSCCRELHAHAPTCPAMRRAQLASFRVTFDLPPGPVSDLRAEAALEAAEVVLHTELRRLLDACQALTGCRMVVERVDDE